MKVWLLYYKERAIMNQQFINMLVEKGNIMEVDIIPVYVEDLFQELKNHKPDAVIARMINPEITKQLVSYNIRVFNNYETAYMCNNKAATIAAINKLGISHIPTLVVSETDGVKIYKKIYSDNMKYNKELDNLQNSDAVYSDYIIKSVSGHGGKEVMLLDEFMDSNITFGKQEQQGAVCYSDKYVIQPLIRCEGRDLRVYIIGNRIIGAVLRKSLSGFKSNFSLGGQVSLYELSRNQISIINKIVASFDFDYVGIDFLLDENDNLIFNEIEDVVGARMLSACSDIDYAGIYIEYIKKQIKNHHLVS